MGWALLTYQLNNVDDTHRTEFEASVALAGWTQVEGIDHCWYGRMGRMNWRQVVISVERMLEISALQSSIDSEVPFVVHTGERPPHFGVARALDPVKRRTRGFRPAHRTKSLPAETKPIRPELPPTKKITKNQG